MSLLDSALPAVQLFTPAERDDNERYKAELLALIASGRALLLVGAGCSVPAGYVTWHGLMRQLEALASRWGQGFVPNPNMRVDDPLRYADLIQAHIRSHTGNLDRYVSLLHDLFSADIGRCSDLHRQFIALPFRGVVTTNYDTLLEGALAECDPEHAIHNGFSVNASLATPVAKFFHACDDETMPRRIAHLHGRFDEADKIILSRSEYLRAYGFSVDIGEPPKVSVEWTLHRKVLWALLATRRVIFVGFSMTDQYLNTMLGYVADDLWSWDKPLHYAIMDLKPSSASSAKLKAENLLRQFGVRVVFYENLDGRHQGLHNMVEGAIARCGLPPITPSGRRIWFEAQNEHLRRM
jgi:hypothetical protein